jgi:hypothetical protein
LRYDNQIIVNPDLQQSPKVAPLNPNMAKAAAAAGVKAASLLTRIGPNERAVPKPAFELTPKKLDANTAGPGAKVGTKDGANKKSGAKLSVVKATPSLTSATSIEKKASAAKPATSASPKKKAAQVTSARLRVERKKHPAKTPGAAAKSSGKVVGQKPSPGIAKTPASEEPSD